MVKKLKKKKKKIAKTIPKKKAAKTVSKKAKKKPRGKPFAKGHKLAKGRKSGSKNQITTLKQAFFDVFDKLGGVQGLHEWADKSDENTECFYKMMSKMLPREVALSGTMEKDIKEIKVEIVSGDNS